MQETFEKHLALVTKVLHTLATHGIKIKPGKCVWFQNSVEFLGHIIGETGLKKSPDFLDKVDKFPCPETVGQL